MNINARISDLVGIGKFYSIALNKRGIRFAKELMWHIPKRCSERDVLNAVGPEHADEEVAVNGKIVSVIRGSGKLLGKTLMSIKTASDQSISVLFFIPQPPRILYVGNSICLHGVIQKSGDSYKMTHPSWSIGHQSKYIDVDYGIQGIANMTLNKVINSIIDQINEPEWLDPKLIEAKGWMGFKASLKCLHNPNMPRLRALERLKFDEACAYAFKIRKAMVDLEDSSPAYVVPESDITEILENFFFELTEDQAAAWEEIKNDLISPKRMMRILYGDVGSGKTLVGFLAMFMTYKAGKQAAILAPTEILANQHYELMQRLAPEAKVVLLTRNSKKRDIYNTIAQENCIIIGTHALIQEKVEYFNLGLLVVDEQHRFGVLQRAISDAKLQYNVLLMTATPIPRTLKLSVLGHIPMSKILSRPQKHRQIEVEVIHQSKVSIVIEKIRRALEEEDSVFWVCPNIYKETKREGMNVMTRSEILEHEFPGMVISMHGRMAAATKDAVLKEFISGQKRILVSTTVIEVGVNIPHANTIIVENSEFFGMAQLYQLMGRVGRGTRPGKCYLVYNTASQETRRRLSALKNCKSGIELAEQDMQIRGYGNILGLSQNGDIENYFKIVDIEDYELFMDADKYVEQNTNPAFERGMQYLSSALSYLEVPWKSG